MGEFIRAGDEEFWVDQRGSGPDVLLIGGLGDPVESWAAQLEGLAPRYRLTAFDNRGVGRTALPSGAMSVGSMADDAAAVLRAVGVDDAHVAGFSGGSAIAQELALGHPDAVRSLVLMSTYARWDAYGRAMFDFWRWMVDEAPSERAMLEAFFLWIYTPRAHENGFVDRMIEDTLAFDHPQSAEGFKAQLEALRGHDTFERLPAIQSPTLVMAGELDLVTPHRFGRAVADRIPGASFEVLPGEAHEPFQESPDDFNRRVDRFWSDVEALV